MDHGPLMRLEPGNGREQDWERGGDLAWLATPCPTCGAFQLPGPWGPGPPTPVPPWWHSSLWEVGAGQSAQVPSSRWSGEPCVAQAQVSSHLVRSWGFQQCAADVRLPCPLSSRAWT